MVSIFPSYTTSLLSLRFDELVPYLRDGHIHFHCHNSLRGTRQVADLHLRKTDSVSEKLCLQVPVLEAMLV